MRRQTAPGLRSGLVGVAATALLLVLLPFEAGLPPDAWPSLGRAAPVAAAGLAEPSPARPSDLLIRLDLVAEGFDGPVFLTGAADGSGDRLVVEQRGRVLRLHAAGVVDAEPMLDIVDRVLHHDERGLLGLALHPSFARNGRFFVAYSRRTDGATVVSEFSLEPGPPRPGVPVEATDRLLLVIPQRYTTHKGGMLAFDHDGMLIISTGDGGSAYDPFRNGLDRRSLLGKLLRIDVDSGSPYAIPADNGFAADPEARAEIHAIGLRNPWRFSVDRASGDLYIGDVGQSAWEEVDVLPVHGREASFGWSEMEGPDCLGDRPCQPDAHVPPAIAYGHGDADGEHCGIIGGYAYRGDGDSLPQGTYLYGDYCSGVIWSVAADQLVSGTAVPSIAGRLDPSYGQLQSFGEDDAGELYLVTSGGHVLHISEAG